MWTRVEVKTKAKDVLRNTYWMALIISLILYVAGTNYFLPNKVDNSNDFNIGNNSAVDDSRIYSIGNVEVNLTNYSITVQIPEIRNAGTITIGSVNPAYVIGFIPHWAVIFQMAGFLLIAILSLFLKIFIGYNIQIGGCKYFLQTAQKREGNLSDLFFAFLGGKYWNIVGTMFLRDLFTFLWTLLFVIPGIIKKYSYTFVPYILAENPDMEPDAAIRMSMDMTRGHKWDMFVLNLSFLGWYILGSAAFGIGVAFVWPYENATFAQLYLILRKEDTRYGEN